MHMNWTSSKLKALCTLKDIMKHLRRQPTEWGKLFANQIYPIYIYVSCIYKEPTQTNNKKGNNPVKNEQRLWLDIYPKNIQMANKHKQFGSFLEC